MADVLGSLSVMSHQDEMELSSEAGHVDEDFDIDFEPTTEARDNHHEDAMQDDIAGQEDQDIELRSATDVNDYMEDDGVTIGHGATSPDGLMLDVPPPALVDEDLLDLSEDEAEAQARVVPDAFEHQEAQSNAGGGANVEDALGSPTPLGHDLEQPNEEGNGSHVQNDRGASEDLHHQQHRGNLLDGHDPHDSNHPNMPVVPTDQTSHNATSEQSELLQSEAPYHVPAGDLDSNAKPKISDEVGVSESTPHVLSLDQPQSEEKSTVTGLHPTIVIYDGGRYSLFPSSEPADGEEYFLEDENLVNGSIGDLLHACRVVLAETISEDDELELGIGSLGLFVGEDSTIAFSTSFSELLDLFVHLHMNDGDLAPPLNVSLKKKPRFANRFTLLANAVAEGKGISQVLLKADSQVYDDSGIRETQDQDETQYQDAVESYGENGANNGTEKGQDSGDQDEPYELDISNDSVADNDGDAEDDEKSANDRTDSSSNNPSYEGSRHEHGAGDHQQSSSPVEEQYDVDAHFTEGFTGEESNTFEDKGDSADQAFGDDHRDSADVEVALPDDVGKGPAASLLAVASESGGEDQFEEFLVTEDSIDDDEQAKPLTIGEHDEAEATERQAAEKDEIDFEDDLEDGDNANANDQDDISITFGTPRGKGKRGLDETDTDQPTDPEAKRPRPS